jgi:uncharacterized membrane protein YgcG
MSAFLQRAADALALAALCGIGDAAPSRSAPWLALVGATTFFLLPLAIASLLLGTAGKFFTALVAVDLASLLTRAAALHDRSQPLDRPNTTSFGCLAQALLFFPETLYRSMGQGPHAAGLIASKGSKGGGSKGGGSKSGGKSQNSPPIAVECWSGGSNASSLCISGVPPLSVLRRCAYDQSQGTQTVVVNLCSWWSGHAGMCAELGIEYARFPAGRADTLDVVAFLKRKLLLHPGSGGGGGGGGGSSGGGGGGGEATDDGSHAVRVLMHCETGAFAAAVATAFLTAVEEDLDGPVAAVRVSQEVAGQLPCHPAEGERLARLVVELTSHGKKSGGKVKAEGKGAAGKTNANAQPEPAARGKQQQQAQGGGDSSDDSEEEEAAEEEARLQAERATRLANYQQAVNAYGLPGTRPASAAAGGGGGWTQVVSAPAKPSRTAYGMDYATTARAALPPASAADGLTDKQRKNRRKQEKAKEETARREAEMVQRRAETIRQRFKAN